MADNTYDSLPDTNSSSNTTVNNTNTYGSQYHILPSSDPTKIKLKRHKSELDTSSWLTDLSLYYDSSSQQFNNSKRIEQVTNRINPAIPSSTLTPSSHGQIPFSSSSVYYGINSAVGLNHAPNSSYVQPNSKLDFSFHNFTPSNNYHVNQKQSSSTANSLTMTSQMPFSTTKYQTNNIITEPGCSSNSYLGSNNNHGPSGPSTNSDLSSFSSSVASVDSLIPGVAQNSTSGNVNIGNPNLWLYPFHLTSTTNVKARKKSAPATSAALKKPRGRPKKARLAISHNNNPVNTTSTTTNHNQPKTKMLLNPNLAASLKLHKDTSSTTPTTLPSTVTSTSTVVHFPATFTSNTLPSTSMNSTVTQIAPIVTAKTPMPPNWLDNCEDTIMSLFTFKTYTLSSSTAEYQTIADMLHSVKVTKIEQIVNPDLWKRFVNTRKEMLRSKTDDLTILPKLGLNEREVFQCAHSTLNFRKDSLLIPYSDNMALLFHCTKNQTNLTNILNQGLDERMSSTYGGLLGKGIYFADDAQKSLQYDGTSCILIFAVLLGDCISVDHFPNKNQLVREPDKVPRQKRNFNDQFFDSIVARPASYNEYVIYNRYQCCPLYQIAYDRAAPSKPPKSNFNDATKSLPPIAWIPEGINYAMPSQKEKTNWPFYAVDLFEKMGVPRPTDEDVIDPIPNNSADTQPSMSFDEKLETLANLGFFDVDKNKEILCRFNNDLDQTVNYFLDQDTSDGMMNSNQPSTSTAASSNLPSTSPSTSPSKSIPSTSRTSISTDPKDIVTIDLIYDSDDSDVVEIKTNDETIVANKVLPEEIAEWALELDTEYLREHPKSPLMDDCSICCNEYECFATSPQFWKQLQCSHKLCLDCYSTMLSTRSTMSGVQHTFVKCPFCQGITGTEIGTCPDIQMNVSIIPQSCESYEPTNSISINYFVNSSHRLNRTAFLPNNAEGQEVLRLLKIAYDRRLCFTIGTSVTSGQENVIVWNIHHKTSLRGGVSSYGYPDPGYMERVKCELKAYGIE